MFYKKFALCIFTITLLLSGCNSPVYNQTEGNVADASIRAKEALKKSDISARPIPVVIWTVIGLTKHQEGNVGVC